MIVGHSDTLFEDPYWKAMIHFAIRRGCFRGIPPARATEQTGMGGISRLEELFLMRSKGGSSQDVLASSVARLAMNGD